MERRMLEHCSLVRHSLGLHRHSNRLQVPRSLEQPHSNHRQELHSLELVLHKCCSRRRNQNHSIGRERYRQRLAMPTEQSLEEQSVRSKRVLSAYRFRFQ